MILAVVLHVPHDLDVGGRTPQPRLLGREDPRAVQVDAAGPCREGGDGARRGNFPGAGRSGGEGTGRRSERDRERPEQAGRQPEAAVLAWACHASILPQDAGSCHGGRLANVLLSLNQGSRALGGVHVPTNEPGSTATTPRLAATHSRVFEPTESVGVPSGRFRDCESRIRGETAVDGALASKTVRASRARCTTLRADGQRPQSLGQPQVLGVVDRHLDERRPIDRERALQRRVQLRRRSTAGTRRSRTTPRTARSPGSRTRPRTVDRTRCAASSR